MLHKGKAHTYGLDGPFGIAYGSSVIWFIGSLIAGLPFIISGMAGGILLSLVGLMVAWILGLIAVCHRRSVWKLLLCESVALLLGGLILFRASL